MNYRMHGSCALNLLPLSPKFMVCFLSVKMDLGPRDTLSSTRWRTKGALSVEATGPALQEAGILASWFRVL